MLKMKDIPSLRKSLADFLSVDELAKIIAKLPEESQARIRAERPVIRKTRIIRTRK